MKKILILTSIFIFSVVTGVFAQVQVPPAEITAEVITGGGDNALVRVSYIFPDGYHQSFQKDFFSFSIESPAGATLGEISYPAPADAGESFDFYGKTILEAEITGYDGSEDLVIRARWQLCDEDGTCYFPASAAVTAEIIETGAPPRPAGRSENLLLILLMAFAGGLLLNVMPCVLPVLSIKALALVKQGGENRRQILGSSLLYTAGVIISLLALAVVVIIIKASGEQVGWGFQFQNRGFVIVPPDYNLRIRAVAVRCLYNFSPRDADRSRGIREKRRRGPLLQRDHSRAACNSLHCPLSGYGRGLCVLTAPRRDPLGLLHGRTRAGFSVYPDRGLSPGG